MSTRTLIVLALVAIKLLIEDIYKIGPVASLAMVALAFAIGIIASIVADRRDPDVEAKREERSGRTTSQGPGGTQAAPAAADAEAEAGDASSSRA